LWFSFVARPPEELVRRARHRKNAQERGRSTCAHCSPATNMSKGTMKSIAPGKLVRDPKEKTEHHRDEAEIRRRQED